MENYYDIFVENLETEIKDFRASYDFMGVAETYNDWYVIGFFEAYFELFMSEYYEYEDCKEIYKWLSEFGSPLAYLYDEWLGADAAFNHNWDAMWDFVEEVYKTCENLKNALTNAEK